MSHPSITPATPPTIARVVDPSPGTPAPSLYYFGVTTHASAAVRCVPRWAEAMGVRVRLVCVNAPVGTSRHVLLNMLRSHEQIAGALATGHKMELGRDLDLYASVTRDARRLREVGTIRLQDGVMHGDAHDVSAGRDTARSLLKDRRWMDGARHVVVLGAGGAGLALAAVLAETPGVAQVMITERSANRRRDARQIMDEAELTGAPPQLRSADRNDDLVAAAPPGTLVINATGMGKDVPGSPLSDSTPWPVDCTYWDLNYRGSRPLLQRAISTLDTVGGRAVDGWDFFVRSWYEVLRVVLRADWGASEFESFVRGAEDVRSVP